MAYWRVWGENVKCLINNNNTLTPYGPFQHSTHGAGNDLSGKWLRQDLGRKMATGEPRQADDNYYFYFYNYYYYYYYSWLKRYAVLVLMRRPKHSQK